MYLIIYLLFTRKLASYLIGRFDTAVDTLYSKHLGGGIKYDGYFLFFVIYESVLNIFNFVFLTPGHQAFILLKEQERFINHK